MLKIYEDYEMIPGSDEAGDTWDIRILKGMYTETVIRYNSMKVSEKTDPETGDGFLTFDYSIVSSPNEELDLEDPDLVEVVQQIMYSILEMTVQHLEKSEAGT